MKNLTMLWGLAVALSIGAISALAGEQEELDILLHVQGTIEIGPEGEVHDFALKTRLAPGLAGIIDRQVRQWRFEPVLVDGRPVIARARVSMSLEAHPAGDGYDLRVRALSFGDSVQPTAQSAKRHAMRYPDEANGQGIGARVLVAIRIDDQGHVTDAHPYQISLTGRASEAVARRWRAVFERAVMSKIRHWQYRPAEMTGERSLAGDFIAAIEFRPAERLLPGREGWRAYVPGPVTPVPWMDTLGEGAFDAVAAGTALALSSGIRLKEEKGDGGN